MQHSEYKTIHVAELGADFVRIHPQLWHMHRSLKYEVKTDEFDVMGRYWCFCVAVAKTGQACYWQDKKLRPLLGHFCIFLPALSLVQWQFQAGVVSFDSIFSIAELPDWVPKVPTVFPFVGNALPQNPESIFQLLQEGKKNYLNLEICSSPNALARKTKEKIDLNFTEECSLDEIAAELGTSLTVLGRYFKRDYGLSPLNYRNRLRVRDAMRAILFSDQSITEIGHAVGFGDTSQLNRNFQKIANYPPSLLRFEE